MNEREKSCGTYPHVLDRVEGHVVRGLLAIERSPQLIRGQAHRSADSAQYFLVPRRGGESGYFTGCKGSFPSCYNSCHPQSVFLLQVPEDLRKGVSVRATAALVCVGMRLCVCTDWHPHGMARKGFWRGVVFDSRRPLMGVRYCASVCVQIRSWDAAVAACFWVPCGQHAPWPFGQDSTA